VFVVIVTVMAFNGAIMLASPKAWFRLPASIRMSGTLREDKYATGLASLEIRAGGLLVLALMGVFVYVAFFRP
jgi:hypothetical protein